MKFQPQMIQMGQAMMEQGRPINDELIEPACLNFAPALDRGEERNRFSTILV